ncbi:Fc.00g008020.m01.CDS01 [Cosmosporella sp. VM-42]
MPPTDPVAAGRDRKTSAVIDFSKDLLSNLPTSRDAGSIEMILADINHHIHTLNTPTQKPASLSFGVTHDLKRCGRDLWNECIKERRKRYDGLAPKERSRLLVRARLFAFQINALAREGSKGRKSDVETDVVYMMNMALTVARLCIEDSDLDGARLALHKVAEYIERLKEVPGDNMGLRGRLQAEYLTMRTALSWKEDRLDVAEHMYSKTDTLRNNLDASSAEHMADALQHIGSDLSSRGDFGMALKWLRRAYELINGQDLERLSAEGLELRLAICHDLVQAMLGVGSPECVQEANDLVAFVESEIGDKPVVLHWRLEILQKSPGEIFDTEAYASILRRMIRSIDFSDTLFSFLLHHIKELRERNSRLAIGLLDELLLTRVLQSNNAEWVGKTLVRRVWMSTMDSDSSTGATDLMILLRRIPAEFCDLLHPDATGAAHSLVWKKLDASYVKKQFKSAELWCQIALHPIFSSCGEANQGKFGRKLILCAIGSNELDVARAAFHSMPESIQNDALTRYLMFKASLIGWDHELGCQSIEHLSKSGDRARSQNMLYACIREAQQVGDKLCTLAALKAVVENYDSGTSLAANFPSILRCTIKLIHLIEGKEDEMSIQSHGFVEDTCRIFEKGAEYAKSDPRDDQGNKLFTVPELEWFRKNAYNIGVTKCHE